MTALKPNSAFQFNEAVSQLFQSPDGKAFAWRLLFWTSLPMSVVYLICVPLIAGGYPAFVEYNWLNVQATLSGSAPPDPNILWEAMLDVLPGYILMVLGFWIVYAMGEAALHRKLLKNQEYAKRPIGFGADELRVLGAQLGVFLIWTAVYFVSFVLTMVLGGAIGAAVPALGGLIILAGILFMLWALIAIPIRLAPAAALSIRKDRLTVREAGQVTKNRFWKLLGAYVVVGIGGYLGVYLIFSLGLLLVTGSDEVLLAVNGLSEQNPRVIFEAVTPRLQNPFIVLLIVLFIIAYTTVCVFWYFCLSGIAIYALRLWEAERDVF